jgi:hypothetical protein
MSIAIPIEFLTKSIQHLLTPNIVPTSLEPCSKYARLEI